MIYSATRVIYEHSMVMPPAAEPITLAEAKDNLGVGHDQHDAIITRLIRSAHRMIISERDMTLIDTTWSLTTNLSEFRLPKGPAFEVVSVHGADETLFDPGDYMLVSPRSLRVERSRGWGCGATRITYRAGAPTLEAFLAGFSASAVEAVHLIVSFLYENRIPVEPGKAPQIPPAIKHVLDGIAPIA